MRFNITQPCIHFRAQNSLVELFSQTHYIRSCLVHLPSRAWAACSVGIRWMQLAWHPCRPTIASVSVTGKIYLWAKQMEHAWSNVEIPLLQVIILCLFSRLPELNSMKLAIYNYVSRRITRANSHCLFSRLPALNSMKWNSLTINL